MHQILKRFVVLIVSSILLILVISSFTPVCVAISASSVDSEPEPEYSRAKGSEYIVELWSEAKDETEDSSFDTLNFGIKLNIPSSDEYLFDAVLKPLGIHADDYVRKNLDVGEHEVILTFDGTDIYKGGRDGPFTINVTVYKGNSEIMIEVEHETESYLFLDFNPKPIKESSGMELITVVNNTIRLETETFVVKIYELTPSIVFYYKSDDGQTTRFRISYEDIIGFNDENSDGVYQVEELKYWGQLEDSQWSSPKTLIEDFNNFDFQVQTIVDLFDANSKPVDSTRIELVFHYSSLSKAEDIEAARKFDISIKILGAPLEGITHLALKHSLEDEMANHAFLAREDKISYMTEDDKEHGYYSWMDNVDVTTITGDTSQKEVTYNFVAGDGPYEKKLYLYYPYSMDTSELYHDPVIGVNPENAPRLPTPETPPVISHGQWIIIYLIVAIIAGGAMAGNFYHQKKKR